MKTMKKTYRRVLGFIRPQKDSLLWDVMISSSIVFTFATLGYLSREFALDLQTYFYF